MENMKFDTKIKSAPIKFDVFKVLIVDDDVHIHEITKFILNDFDYKNYKLEFISAYSGEEAREIIKNTSDIALVLLDVVMETSDAGLEVVRYIREELDNHLMRIIIRTGQPGYAPENEVIASHMQKVIDNGLAPDIVGERVVEAVSHKELYIFTHPNYRKVVQERFKAIDDAFARSESSPLLADILDEQIVGFS